MQIFMHTEEIFKQKKNQTNIPETGTSAFSTLERQIVCNAIDADGDDKIIL